MTTSVAPKTKPNQIKNEKKEMRMETDQPTKYQIVVHTQSLYRLLNVFILYLKPKTLNSDLKKKMHSKLHRT